MKLSRKNQALKDELTRLSNQYGYWSNEVYDFNGTLDYDTMRKINQR